MRHIVVSQCVVDADTPEAAFALVADLLDDGSTTRITLVDVEEDEPSEAELSRFYESAGMCDSLDEQAAIQRWRA